MCARFSPPKGRGGGAVVRGTSLQGLRQPEWGACSAFCSLQRVHRRRRDSDVVHDARHCQNGSGNICSALIGTTMVSPGWISTLDPRLNQRLLPSLATTLPSARTT